LNPRPLRRLDILTVATYIVGKQYRAENRAIYYLQGNILFNVIKLDRYDALSRRALRDSPKGAGQKARSNPLGDATYKETSICA